MNDTVLESSPIVEAYRQRTPGSAALFEEARSLFPSGITHDSRFLQPYGIYATKALGSRKWDVDGNEYVDYSGGHGALLLGHSHPEVSAAVQQAFEAGTHFGDSHETEIQWARVIQRLVPSADQIRFTSSGTEATLMAVRLARAHTGKSKIMRLQGHFHGWHDHMTSGYNSHHDGSPTRGVLPSLAEKIILLSPNDIDIVGETLASDKDIAALILEPTGSTFGMVPLAEGYLAALRELTKRHSVVLIFDEVVTGFRVSKGGAQAHYGVIPDLTALAKIVAGGLPGAAVVGLREILEALDFEVTSTSGKEKIQHQGTFNANPVSATAGYTALSIIETSKVNETANASGEFLRQGMNQVLQDMQIPWAAYGEFSGIHVFTNPESRPIEPAAFDPLSVPWPELKGNVSSAVTKLRLAMLTNGVEFNGWPGGTISSVHSEADLNLTIDVFKESLKMLRSEGEV
ncbi:MAG TPA: aminotransferase class III-fold pyridoxal phosphate-dependent enzyme [Gammaproteobacteria bacterium]|nr:aminotransferase class III-fold pyridoxal phosphate-dependent enzyme [Gammaproteobacteria bacterium]